MLYNNSVTILLTAINRQSRRVCRILKKRKDEQLMKHNPEITAQTRKNLMDAFWDLYSEKGIGKVTVRGIVSKAGYNRSTFYEYFIDVYDVLAQIEVSLLPDIEKHKDIVAHAGPHFPIKHLTMVYSQNKKYLVVLLGKNGDPAFQEKIKNVYKALIKPLFQTPGTDDFILKCRLEYAISAMLGVMTYCFTQEENPDIEKMVWLVGNLMNEGVMKSFKWDTSIE
jgi:uncharacterized protein YneF (UPF0154 family)